MDPIGFSLENFDAVGAWRTKEGGTGGTPIDASGQLLDGTKINGPVELRKALLKNPEIFVDTFTEKLMTYALGRGLQSTRICRWSAPSSVTRRGQLPLHFVCDRNHPQYAISNADQGGGRTRGVAQNRGRHSVTIEF